MHARREGGILGLLVLSFGLVGCGRAPAEGPAVQAAGSPLVTTEETLGPLPLEGGSVLRPPLLLAAGADGWLATWGDGPWFRGVRLDAEGRPVDPTPGLLLDPEYAMTPYSDVCRPAALDTGWLVACRDTVALLGSTGPPAFVAAPWPESRYLRFAVGGHDRALVRDAEGWWALTAEGGVAWQQGFPWADTATPTPDGFLLGGAVAGEPFATGRVQPIDVAGRPGEAVELTGPVVQLAAGPAGVLALLGGPDSAVQPLAPATGEPTGLPVEVPLLSSVTAVEDGWYLAAGGEAWHLDPDLNLTPATLPLDPATVGNEAFASGDTRLLEVGLSMDLAEVRAGQSEAAPVTLARGREAPTVVGLGAVDGLALVVERANRPEGQVLRAWRVGDDGDLLDASAVLLWTTASPALSPQHVAVAGAGASWLVAMGEVGAVRLFEVPAEGPPSERGTVDCDLGGEELVTRSRVTPVLQALSDGWMLACLDRGSIDARDRPSTLLRPALLRLDTGLSPLWEGPRPLEDWVPGPPPGESPALVATRIGPERLIVAWPRKDEAVDWATRLQLVEVDASDASVVQARVVPGADVLVGLEARNEAFAVLTGHPGDDLALEGAIFQGLADPAPAPLRYTPEAANRVAVGPFYLDDQLWACATSGTPELGAGPVVCARLDPDGDAVPLEEVAFGGYAHLGWAVATEDSLLVAYRTWRDGTVQGALTALTVSGVEPGDGGSTDGGTDAGPADDGGPSDGATDAGPTDGGATPDAGGSDGGTDAGEPEPLDGGGAGTPEDSGCGGCTASGASWAGGLLVLLALLPWLGRGKTWSPGPRA